MKKLVILLSIGMIVNLKANAQAVTNGLIAYYPFNGNAQDESTNTYHGQIGTSTLTTDRFGITSSAYYFDNTASDTIGFDVPFQSGNFSIAYWMMPDYWGDGSGTKIPMVLDWRNKTNINSAFSINLFSDTSVRFLLRDAHNQNPYTALFVHNIASLKRETRWVHVAFVYEHPILRVYANGQLIDQTNSDYSDTFNFNRLLLARNYYQNLQPSYNTKYTGKIDDIYIFDRAIDTSEIIDIYTATPDTSTSVSRTLLKNNAFKLYPNPTSDYIYLDFNDLKTNYNNLIVITDIFGRTVLRKEVNNKTSIIDVSNLNLGSHLVHLYDRTTGEKLAVNKLIKY